MPHLPAFMTGSSSMPAGRYTMRNGFVDQELPRPAYAAQTVTPYLGLRSRLSQIWINRWTILLMLVLARTLITIGGINSDLASSRREALSACSSVESMGSAMASMPHYMAQGVNDMAAVGIEKAVNALMQISTMAITAVEEIVIFVIHMMTSTYLCLITFAVTGSAKVVLDALEDAQNSLNDLTKSLGDDMADVVQAFNTAYDAAKKLLSTGIVGAATGLDLPTLDTDDDINKLRNLKLPPGLGADLSNLKDNLPNFQQVENFTDGLIRTPFEIVRNLVNSNFGNYTFDRDFFPTPKKKQMTFCSDDDGINDFFDNLLHIAAVAKKIFIGVLLVAAILACFPMAWREIRRYNTMRERSQLVGSGKHDPMDVVYMVSRPYTASAGIKVSHAARSERRQALIRWVVAYATTEAALFVLCLAIAGLFSCLCQYVLVKSLEKEVPALSSQVANFADKVITSLNNASASWANGANAKIIETNNTINGDLLGWVNTTTLAVNDTLTQFVDTTTGVLNQTFGNTPLYEPILEVLNCLLLLKVAGIQKGITWVHDNAHVNLPLMNNDTFTVGAIASIAADSPADQSFLADPGDAAADKITTAIARFLIRVYDGIRVEALISTVVLMIWVAIVLIGIIRATTLWFKHEKLRGEGGGTTITGAAAPYHIPNTPVMQQRQQNNFNFNSNSNSNSNNDFRSDGQDRYRSDHITNIPMSQVSNRNHDHYATSRSLSQSQPQPQAQSQAQAQIRYIHDQDPDHGLPAYTKEVTNPNQNPTLRPHSRSQSRSHSRSQQRSQQPSPYRRYNDRSREDDHNNNHNHNHNDNDNDSEVTYNEKEGFGNDYNSDWNGDRKI